MVAVVFPFTMELLVVVLFSLLAVPVWIATRLLDALDGVLGEKDVRGVTRPRSGRDRRR